MEYHKMDTYIVVQYRCNYSSDDWHIRKVYNNESEAVLCACRLLQEEASLPYVIEYYQSHTTYVNLSDYFVEHWKNNEKIKTITVGYQHAPYTHYTDKYLKDNCNNIKEILNKWKNSLDSEIIPVEIGNFIFVK